MSSLLSVTTLTLLISSFGAAPHQAGTKAAAPPIPSEAAEAERTALTRTSSLLAKGMFREAAANLGPQIIGPVTRVWIDWTPVPMSLRRYYKSAVQAAVHQWNARISPATRFDPAAREEDADLRILFDRSVVESKLGQPRLICSETRCEPSGIHRSGVVRIALDLPYADGPHQPASITHLVEQGFGSYLGIGPSNRIDSVMGPDNHISAPATTISDADVRTAQQLMGARAKLADYVLRRVVIKLPRARFSAERTEIDAGDVWRGDDALFVFKIKNTGDAPLEIDAHPTCGCTVANFDRVIGPGAEGKIEASVHTTSFRGKVTKVIEVRSNDLDAQNVNLQLIANVKSAISILPAESPLIGLKSGSSTTQDLEIRIADKEPVQITRVVCSAPYATASVAPLPSQNGTAFRVTLTIDPAAPMGRSAFIVSAFTTSKREPQVNITTFCEKGIVVMPPSAYLGTVEPRTVLPLNQFVTISRREGSLAIQKIDNEDPKLEVRQTTMQEGKQYRLQLVYKGGWPSGLIQRKIVVYTDDPAQPRIEIPVMANVTPVASDPNAK